MANTSQKIALSTVAQIGGRFAQAALGLVSVALLTRYLGINGYGEYSTVFAYTGLAAVIADFGTTTLIIREATQRRAPIGDLIGSGVAVSVLIGILTTAAFAAAVLFMPYSSSVKEGILVALVAVFIGNLNIYGSFFSIHTRLDMMVLIEVLGRVVSVAALAGLVLMHAPFIWMVAAAVLGMAFNAVLGSILVLRRGIKLRVDPALVRHILKHSLPIGMIYILSLLQYRMDAVILSLMRPSADMAIYTLATKINDIVVMIPAFFVAAAYPTLSAAFSTAKDTSGSADFRTKSRLVFNYLLIIGLPVVVGAFILASNVVGLLGSSAYAAAATPLRVLCVTALFGYIVTYFGNLALVGGLQKKMVWRVAVLVAVNAAANVALIPVFGYNGAAAGALIANLLSVGLSYSLLRGRVAVGLDLALLARTLLAVAAMGAAVWLVRDHGILIPVIAGAITYPAVVFLLKIVRPNDVRKLINR
jgi:O-antigen/teichoic acid export membrane protein